MGKKIDKLINFYVVLWLLKSFLSFKILPFIDFSIGTTQKPFKKSKAGMLHFVNIRQEMYSSSFLGASL